MPLAKADIAFYLRSVMYVITTIY